MSKLSIYNQSARDKAYPDKDETVFGHLVLEMGLTIEQALTRLRPQVKGYATDSEQSKNVCSGLAGVGLAASVLIAATSGIGIPAIAPLCGALLAGLFAWESSDEEPQRSAEYAVLRTAPGLIPIMYALGKRGLKPEIMVEAYDQLIRNFGSHAGQHKHLGVDAEVDFGEVAIVQSFQKIFEEKAAISSHSQTLVDEWGGAGFEAIYQNNQLPTQAISQVAAIAPAQETRVPAASEPINPAPIIQPSPVQAISQTPAISPMSSIFTGNIPDRELYKTAASESLIDTFINCPSQCRAILAGQRAGKTMAAAIATRVLASQGAWIGYINLQDHGQGNAEAFSHAHRIMGNLASLGDSREGQVLVDAATNLIAEFYAQDDAILVIDEWMSLGAKTLQVEGLVTLWREIANKATALSSNGIGSGKAIWGIAPFFKAESLRDDAKCLKLFAPLIIAIAPGQSFPWTNPKNGKLTQITYNQQVVNHAAINWSSTIKDPTPEQSHKWKLTGCDRVYWWNGNWEVVGEMPAPPKSEIAVPSMLGKPRVDSAVIEKIAIALAETAMPQAVSEVARLRSAGDTKGAIAVLINGDDLQALQNRCKADPDSVKAIYEWVQN